MTPEDTNSSAVIDRIVNAVSALLEREMGFTPMADAVQARRVSVGKAEYPRLTLVYERRVAP